MSHALFLKPLHETRACDVSFPWHRRQNGLWKGCEAADMGLPTPGKTTAGVTGLSLLFPTSIPGLSSGKDIIRRYPSQSIWLCQALVQGVSSITLALPMDDAFLSVQGYVLNGQGQGNKKSSERSLQAFWVG